MLLGNREQIKDLLILVVIDTIKERWSSVGLTEQDLESLIVSMNINYDFLDKYIRDEEYEDLAIKGKLPVTTLSHEVELVIHAAYQTRRNDVFWPKRRTKEIYKMLEKNFKNFELKRKKK